MSKSTVWDAFEKNPSVHKAYCYSIIAVADRICETDGTKGPWYYDVGDWNIESLKAIMPMEMTQAELDEALLKLRIIKHHQAQGNGSGHVDQCPRLKVAQYTVPASDDGAQPVITFYMSL